MPLISLEGLTVRYGEIEALHGLSLSVEAGEVVTLLGANGAGKSTTLRTISGLLKPTAGDVRFEGKSIAASQFSPAQTLDPADLARVFPLKKGDSLGAETVASAIDGLFSTGRFDDIVVEVEPSGDGVLVRFVTTNTWLTATPSTRLIVSVMSWIPPIAYATLMRFMVGVPFGGVIVTLSSRGIESIEIVGLLGSIRTSSISLECGATNPYGLLFGGGR